MRRALIPKIFKNNKGVAAIEFGLILPILVVLFVGLAEISWYALSLQKQDKATSDMADLITQNKQATLQLLNGYADAIDQIMDPFDLNGTVIVSSVAAISRADADAVDLALAAPSARDARAPIKVLKGCRRGCVVWQWKRGPDTSTIGATGGEAQLPGGYGIQDATHNVLVVETVRRHTTLTNFADPFVQRMLSPVRRIVLLKPREQTNDGDMTTPPT
ncbi:MAG: TadE/TadG family type IV pilus assembly protein [Alphaproteobacteria bacterium]